MDDELEGDDEVDGDGAWWPPASYVNDQVNTTTAAWTQQVKSVHAKKCAQSVLSTINSQFLVPRTVTNC